MEYLIKTNLDDKQKFIDIDVFKTTPSISYLGPAFFKLRKNVPDEKRLTVLFNVYDQERLEKEIEKSIYEKYFGLV